MTAQESRPDENRAVSTAANTHRLIGASVEKALDATLWDLTNGFVELHQLTPALAGFWTLGHAAGVSSTRLTIAKLEHECDRLYIQAYHPADRARIIQQRMDEHFRQEWNLFLQTGGGAE